jgi:hypothetical protein
MLKAKTDFMLQCLCMSVARVTQSSLIRLDQSPSTQELETAGVLTTRKNETVTRIHIGMLNLPLMRLRQASKVLDSMFTSLPVQAPSKR